MRVTDWRGNDYGVGDTVIYGAQSGHSITMVEGTVTDIYNVYRAEIGWKRLDEGQEAPLQSWEKEAAISLRVQIQPSNSTRWTQHNTRTRYKNRNTGKYMNPDSGNGKHVERKSGFNHIPSGRFLTYEEVREEFGNMALYSHNHPDLKWIPVVYKDYVEVVKEDPKPVTLTITENITRI